MLNLTTYWSSIVYYITISFTNLLQFKVIIFKSVFQMFEQVPMRIYSKHKVTFSGRKKVAAHYSSLYNSSS